MSSAEFSSLRSINQSMKLMCILTEYMTIPHFLRDLFHDIVCDDVSMSDALPIAIVVVLS